MKERGGENVRARHTTCQDIARILLNTNLLPVREPALIDFEMPTLPVPAGGIRADHRLGVLELLLDISNDPTTVIADKRAEHEFRAHFTRPCDRT